MAYLILEEWLFLFIWKLSTEAAASSHGKTHFFVHIREKKSPASCLTKKVKMQKALFHDLLGQPIMGLEILQ